MNTIQLTKKILAERMIRIGQAERRGLDIADITFRFGRLNLAYETYLKHYADLETAREAHREATPENAKVTKVKAAQEEVKFNWAIDAIKRILPTLPPLLDEDVIDEDRVVMEQIREHSGELTYWDIGTRLGWMIQPHTHEGKYIWYQAEGAMFYHELVQHLLKQDRTRHQIQPPVLVEESTLDAAGFMDREQDLYKVGHQYLSPTGEVQCYEYIKGQKVDLDNNPHRFILYSECFRNEKIPNGKKSGRLLRTHQFGKVELFSVVHPDKVRMEIDHMLLHVRQLLDRFELSWRVVKLGAKSLSNRATFGFDVEVYFPVLKEWIEVSSISTCGETPAINLNVTGITKGQEFTPHLVNGSGVGVPRLLGAILETHGQREFLELPGGLKGAFNPNYFS